MADTATMPTVAAPAQPAPTQPAASPSPLTQPTGTPTQVVEPSVTAKAVSVLGDYALQGQLEPALEATPAASPDGTVPAPAGQTAPDGQADPAAGAAKLPGEEYLQEIGALALPTAPAPTTPATQEAELPTTPEQMAKVINPDGKASLEQQLTNAQSFIGRRSQEIGTLRKEVEAYKQGVSEISKRFIKDPQSGNIRPTANAVVEFARAVPQLELESTLAEVGLKVVPVNAQVADTREALERAWMEQYVNTVKPGDELTFDEKLQEIEGYPAARRKLDTDLSAWKLASQQQEQQQAFYRQQQQQQETAQNQRLVEGFITELKKSPDYETYYKPAVSAWNSLLGPTHTPDGRPLQGAIRGESRLKVLRALAEVNRFGKILKEVQVKSFEAGRNDITGKLQFGAIPGGGAEPTYVDMGNGSKGGSVTDLAGISALTGARPGPI